MSSQVRNEWAELAQNETKGYLDNRKGCKQNRGNCGSVLLANVGYQLRFS